MRKVLYLREEEVRRLLLEALRAREDLAVEEEPYVDITFVTEDRGFIGVVVEGVEMLDDEEAIEDGEDGENDEILWTDARLGRPDLSPSGECPREKIRKRPKPTTASTAADILGGDGGVIDRGDALEQGVSEDGGGPKPPRKRRSAKRGPRRRR